MQAPTQDTERCTRSLVSRLLNEPNPLAWQMEPAERLAFIAVLDHIRPDVSIEIGTKYGGSLQIISHFSRKVYSIDIDPTCPTQLAGRFQNVEYVTGPSHDTLPPLLERIRSSGDEKLGFVLVDGAHSYEVVLGDINILMTHTPTCPLYILMHDCFNPGCRQALLEARWASNPHVHLVELDFVPGILHTRPDVYHEMWGGLAFAEMRPERRTGDLVISTRNNHLFRTARRMSAHSLLHRFIHPASHVSKLMRKVRARSQRRAAARAASSAGAGASAP